MPIIAFDLTPEFLIPFLFVLAVVFGVLNLTNVFKSRAVSFVIALAIAFFAASYQPFTTLLWAQLGNITTFFIVMFFIAFLLEVFGVRKVAQRAIPESMAMQGAILFILLGVGYMIVDKIPQLPFIGGGQNLLLLIGVIFILMIFWSAFKLGLITGYKPAKEKEEG